MVHLQKSLLFPSLNFQSETKFKSLDLRIGSSPDKTTPIYKLNWDTVDKIKEDRWLKQNTVSSNSKFPGTLPQKYDEWVKNMSFALSSSYMDEIRRTARLAQTEWGTNRSFDTMIREICLQPAIEYTYVAFRMLADCLFNYNTNYFYRGPDKILATQAMLYKFWSFQTGLGLVHDHCKFDKIEDRLNQTPGVKRKVLLMSINCDKCRERSFIESSSEGWKINLNSIDVTCSCGNKLITSVDINGARMVSSRAITPATDIEDRAKNHIKEFLKDIKSHEELLGEPKIEEISQTVKKNVIFTDFNKSVITNLRSKEDFPSIDQPGYNYKITHPKESCEYPSDGEVVKTIKPNPPIGSSMSSEETHAIKEAYDDQVDLKTEPKESLTDSELEKVINIVNFSTMPSEKNDAEKVADNMLLSSLKDGLKDLPKDESDDVMDDGVSFCRKDKNRPIDKELHIADTRGMNKVKILVNGMPLIEIKIPYSTTEKEAVNMAMKDESIKKYTKGKVMAKSFYAPGYFLSMAFQKPDKN